MHALVCVCALQSHKLTNIRRIPIESTIVHTFPRRKNVLEVLNTQNFESSSKKFAELKMQRDNSNHYVFQKNKQTTSMRSIFNCCLSIQLNPIRINIDDINSTSWGDLNVTMLSPYLDR